MSVENENNVGVWTVIHNRPEASNAIDANATDDLGDAV
jgi:enoyl-CoA hydratase/carnithine racemase